MPKFRLIDLTRIPAAACGLDRRLSFLYASTPVVFLRNADARLRGMNGLEGEHRIPANREKAQEEMDAVLKAAMEATPVALQGEQPSTLQPSDDNVADAEKIANSSERLAEWKEKQRQIISRLEGRVAPGIINDLRIKVDEVEVGKPRDVASVRLHLAEVAKVLQQPRRKAPGEAQGGLTNDQIAEEKSRLRQKAEILKGVFPKQAADIARKIGRGKTPSDFRTIEEMIDESIAPASSQGSGAERDATLRSEENVILDLTKPPQSAGATPATPASNERIDPSKVVRMSSPESETERLDPSQIVRVDLNHPPELPPGVSLMTQREIQTNPELEKNFIHVIQRLDSQKGNTLYAKWVTEQILDEQDLRLLSYARRDFALRLHEGTKIAEKLNKADLEIGIRRDPALRDEVELNGVEKTLEVMKKQALALSMKLDPEEFARVTNAHTVLEEMRMTSSFRRWEDKIANFLQKSGKGWGYYQDQTKGLSTKAERIQTRRATEAEILEGRSRILNVLSIYRPTLLFRGFGTSAFNKADQIVRDATSGKWGEIKLANKERKLEEPMKSNLIREVDDQLGVITKFMRQTLNHDPEVRRAIQQSAALNEDIAPQKTGPETFKELRSAVQGVRSSPPSEQKVKQEWSEHLREIKDDWNSWSPQQRQRHRDNEWTPTSYPSRSMTPEGKERPKSFLGAILEAILNVLFDGNKKKLSLNNV